MPNEARIFPAGTGGNPLSPNIGDALTPTNTAQPPIRPPPDPFVWKSVEPFTDDDNIEGYVDGFGNRFWHVDTSASAKAVTFMAAADTVGLRYVVEWHVGANPLIIKETNGANVGGTTTFAAATFGESYMFQSDGTEYHLIAQSSESGFISSNSFSAFTASASFGNISVHGSATFSQTVAFLTSINVSGTASIDTLVVAGTASFSATVVTTTDVRVGGSLFVSGTLSVASVITVAGVPLTSDWAKIGSASISNALAMTFSGSWTAYSALRVEAFYLVSSGPDAFLQLSSDNGTSYFLGGGAVRMPTSMFATFARSESGKAGLISTLTFTFSGATVVNTEMKAGAINAAPGVKYVSGSSISHNGEWKVSASASVTSTNIPGVEIRFSMSTTFAQNMATATANAAQVNQISFSARNRAGVTQTMSGGVIYLYGLK